jgi:hypothetical protein
MKDYEFRLHRNPYCQCQQITHKFITSIQRQILVKKNVKQEIEVMIKENVYFVKHQQQTRTQSSTWLI